MFVRVESVQTKVKWLVTLKKLVVTRAKRLAGLAGHRLTWQHLTLSSRTCALELHRNVVLVSGQSAVYTHQLVCVLFC